MKKAIQSGITAFLITLGVILGIGAGLWSLKCIGDEYSAFDSLERARELSPDDMLDYADRLAH